MKKSELRNIYKQKRAALTPSQKDKLEDMMLIQFQKLRVDIPALIMTYACCDQFNEYDPVLVEDYCYFVNPDQQLCYPLIDRETDSMRSVLADDDTEFAKSKFGIDEPVNGALVAPAEIQLIFVPLLCFDERGYRVGYGKGYYDRFLKECSGSIIKVGFSFFEAEKEVDDVNVYDVPLDHCITPDKVYHFQN